MHFLVFTMQSITIRIDDETFKEIEMRRGTESKSDFYRDVIAHYLQTNVSSQERLEYLKKIDKLEADMKIKEENIRINNTRIEDLQKQVGFLQLEYQKLTERLPKLIPETGKKWYQFWK